MERSESGISGVALRVLAFWIWKTALGSLATMEKAQVLDGEKRGASAQRRRERTRLD